MGLFGNHTSVLVSAEIHRTGCFLSKVTDWIVPPENGGTVPSRPDTPGLFRPDSAGTSGKPPGSFWAATVPGKNTGISCPVSASPRRFEGYSHRGWR